MNNEKKSITTIISLVFTVIVVAVVAGVLIYGMQKPTVKVNENSLQIKSMYGLTVEFSEIDEITLIDKNIDAIALNLKRTNGIGNINNILKGHFDSENLGKILLFVYKGSSPTILIERKDGKDILINYANSEDTKKLYEELMLKFGLKI